MIAQMRTWNDDEIDSLIRRTKREASNIIKRRVEGWRGHTFIELCFAADKEIEDFFKKVLERK